MSFSFLNDLCESRLIPSRTSLKNWDAKKIAELCYLYFLGLRILLSDSDTRKWAESYCKKAGEQNDFQQWRSSGNDLYVMLYALSADPDDTDDEKDIKFLNKLQISPSVIRDWLRHVSIDHNAKESTHKLFLRLDTMFKVTDSSMKSMRRIVTEWDDADEKEQEDVLKKLVQMIHTRAPSNSDLLPHLKKLQEQEKMEESASTGATGAANVATVVGGLGAGFDPDGSWRSIYGQKKPAVIHRNPKTKG